MKSRKEKFIEYQDKYGNIPHDYRERLNYMCDKYKLSPKRMMEIISTRNSILNSMYYKSLKICLYEEPEGTPRPRARLVNRYNILDVSKADSNFIQIYSITGKADNMYMKKLVSQNDYLEANELIHTPCDVCVNVYFKPPSSFTINDLFLAEIGLIRPIKKPDWDNIGKKYSDMYNGNIWLDDDLVIDGQVRKWYSILPRVEIDLKYTNMLFNKSQYNQMRSRLSEDTNINYWGNENV